jgi:chromosome partitioning protein
MKAIALINQKGGTGKTTTAINAGTGLARLGKRVLLIDMDAQASASYSLGIKAHELSGTVYELLKGEAEPEDVIQERDGVKVIPANLSLSSMEAELARTEGREFMLREAMTRGNGLRGFDYVLIDCPPSLGLLTLNALVLAQEVYVCLQCEFLALQGLAALLMTVGTIKSRLNRGLDITGVVATRYDGRKKLNNEVVERIGSHFGKKLFKTLIRENISLAEAPSYGLSIYEYKPSSYGAMDYMNLSKEIIKRG